MNIFFHGEIDVDSKMSKFSKVTVAFTRTLPIEKIITETRINVWVIMKAKPKGR